MVEVTVSRLGLDSSTNSHVVILQERQGRRFLPIWIGQPEAEAIAAQLNGVKRERPMTHDLARSLVTALGGVLRRVQITRVQSSTYFAELHLLRADQLVTVDARPSDSIAIALRLAAPIYVQESLLTDPEGDDEAESGDPDLTPPPDTDGEQLKEYLQGLRPEDFGKFTL
jgi:bifunctional DNase/RNase